MMKETAMILAEEEGAGCVTKCECGAIHVQVGPVNATFTPPAFVQFVGLVNASLPKFEGSAPAGPQRFPSH
jgi:hypothetical protein